MPRCRKKFRRQKRDKLVKVGGKNTWKFDGTKGDSSNKFRLIEGAIPLLSLQRKISMYSPEDTNKNYGYVMCEFKDLRSDKKS
ncbi:MAG: hypothetical protein IKD80_04355 [Selenomonadaceae bacterium]|nr:hypothetical protein [Selenomonadaceae bacterium]